MAAGTARGPEDGPVIARSRPYGASPRRRDQAATLLVPELQPHRPQPVPESERGHVLEHLQLLMGPVAGF